MHEMSLITTIAFGLTAALVFGLTAKRLGLSPIVGYLLGGMAIGPHTPGFVGDPHLAPQLAEIGVILLMFGVGLHFHLKDLMAVKSIAIPGAIGQSTAATLCCLAIALAAGWSWMSGLVLGIAVSVASTVVLLRVLMDHGVVETPQGHVAVGWLIVEDIITVLVLVLLPIMASEGSGADGILAAAGMAVLKLAVLGVIVMVAGAKFVPLLLLRVVRLRSAELFTLTVLVMSISVATLSYMLFGASMALGAFLAGMVVGQSKVSSQAAANALPMRDAFAVLFFVSVGMLFDYRTLWKEPLLVAGVVLVILVIKPLIALLIVLVSGHSLKVALTVAGGLAQIGEFSFILAESAKALKILPDEGSHVLVAGAIVSISVNPWVFKSLLKLEPALAKNPMLARWLAYHHEKRVKLAGAEYRHGESNPDAVKAIVVGYGPVGRTVERMLRGSNIEPVIVEMNIDTVLALQKEGKRALYGDASRPDILRAAGIDAATYLIVTLPVTEAALGIIHSARELNESVRILARARYLKQKDDYEQAGSAVICYDEAEIAAALAEAVLKEVNAPKKQIVAEVGRIQKEFRAR